MLQAPPRLQAKRQFAELDADSQTAYETFERYGNHYLSGGPKPSLGKLSGAYAVPGFNVQVQREDPIEGKDVFLNFVGATVNLEHVGERHSIPFFQFHNKPENTFFKNAGSVSQLKAVAAANATATEPIVQNHLENCDMESWDVLYASTDDTQPAGVTRASGTGVKYQGLYLDFDSEFVDSQETDQTLTENYRFKFKSMAPLEGTSNAISFSQDTLDDIVTWRDEE